MKEMRGRIIAGVLAFIGVFSVILFSVLYNEEKNDINERNINDPKAIATQIPSPGVAGDIRNNYDDDDDDLYESDEYDDDNIKITSDMKYVIQTYYLNSKKENDLQEKTANMPAEFIAMSEDDLEDYLEEYVENMPLEEYLDGLLSYEIISFTPEEITLRKTYASDMNDNQYYISDLNGEIVVYYSDKETVYEYTGIRTEMLEPAEQVKIKIGYYVKDEEALYGMLESYSS